MQKIIDIRSTEKEFNTLSFLMRDQFRVNRMLDIESLMQASKLDDVSLIFFHLCEGNQLEFAELFNIVTCNPNIPVITISSKQHPEWIVRALKIGAFGHLDAAYDQASIQSLLATLDKPVNQHMLIGSSKKMEELHSNIRHYACNDYPVLILGESGTGKELVAKSIHEQSIRHKQNYIALNCATLPDALAESELFGTSKGAFTSAVDRDGALNAANKGSLFLDEIGDTSPMLQAKFLRALETGEFKKLGTHKIDKCDIRLISATSKDIRQSTNFRSDLYYRISTLVIQLPSLREHIEDVPEIANYILFKEVGVRKYFSANAIDKLSGHYWPGNVRELKNTVRRAIAHAGHREEIWPEDVVFNYMNNEIPQVVS